MNAPPRRTCRLQLDRDAPAGARAALRVLVAAAALLATGTTGASPADPARADGSTATTAGPPAAPATASGDASTDPTLADWRAERLARLTADDGWLTPIALLWLEPGRHTFGRARRNALVLDHPALPARAGTFMVADGRVRFTAAPGAGITHAGAAVTTLELADDRSGSASVLERGALQFYVIERVGRLGLRVRDRDNPRRRGFAGLDYFPAADDWIVDARFEPHVPAREIPIMNVLGYEDRMVSPGALVFEQDGREWRLDALLDSPGATTLFVMFADATTGRETYGAGRYLQAPLPRDGRVRLDFNRAYNPPCAFNLYATCPLPPEQNRLALRVTAGELKYAGDEASLPGRTPVPGSSATP